MSGPLILPAKKVERVLFLTDSEKDLMRFASSIEEHLRGGWRRTGTVFTYNGCLVQELHSIVEE